MARARNIKPGFFTNGDLIECSPLARLLFIGLWTEADRRGVLEDRPKTLKLKLLPGDNCDADELLQELADHGFIQRYEAGGARCIYITKFGAHQSPHQKEPESELPAPTEYETCTGHAPDTSETEPVEVEESISSRARALIPDSTTESITESIAQDTRDVSAPDQSFDRFWSLYPRHDDKKAARRSWSRIARSQHDAIYADIDRRMASGEWTPGSQFIPMPTTYLNRERWNDEPRPSGHLSPQPIDPIAAARAERDRLSRREWANHIERQTYGLGGVCDDQLRDRIAELDRIIAGEVAA